jgi:hypothetical protein
MVAILKKYAILIYFSTYTICFVSIDFVYLKYIGINTNKCASIIFCSIVMNI